MGTPLESSKLEMGDSVIDAVKFAGTLTERVTLPEKSLVPDAPTFASTPENPGYVVALEGLTVIEKSPRWLFKIVNAMLTLWDREPLDPVTVTS